MSTSIPLIFRAAPLPSTFKGTPQELLEAIVARLSAESTNTISFFASGSVAPTSNLGPWLKDGREWYVWDNATAAYIPQIISSEALGYIASATAPDPTVYTFWIKLDGAGKAQGVFFYSAGAWKDVYEDTFATFATTTAMNTAIAAAIASSSFNTSPAKGYATSTQSVPVDTNLTKVLAQGEWFDPSNCFDPTLSRYVAPATGYYQVDAYIFLVNDGGDATAMELAFRTAVNGNPYFANGVAGNIGLPSPPGDRWFMNMGGLIQLTAGDYLEVYMSADDGVLSGNVTVNAFSLNVHRVL